MGNYPEEYGKINAVNLLNRVKAIYGDRLFAEKAASIAAGPGFVDRMDEFYEWCYQNDILPL